MLISAVCVRITRVKEYLRGEIGLALFVGEYFEINRTLIGLAGCPDCLLTGIDVSGNGHILIYVRFFVLVFDYGDNRVGGVVEKRDIFSVLRVAVDKFKTTRKKFFLFFYFFGF